MGTFGLFHKTIRRVRSIRSHHVVGAIESVLLTSIIDFIVSVRPCFVCKQVSSEARRRRRSAVVRKRMIYKQMAEFLRFAR